ncbi:DUF4340 domain-containing protein [Candidatus Peregrinibacteria bacterium]|nr:DUF4340 domain-containing protein [Candidatus Peregrinibacteria bacterium]
MTEKFEQSFDYFKKMSTLKKVLIVFVILLIFIIVVEQPGRDAKKRQSEKFFIPKFVIEDVTKVQMGHAAQEREVILEKGEGGWRVVNGHSFPADTQKVDDFLKAMYSLKEGSVVSNNPERTAIFSVDEKNGIHVQAWNHKERAIADFYAGETIPDGQYLRRADEDEVFQTIPSLTRFLTDSLDSWKDKTLLSVEEADVRRFSLKTPEEEIVLEKKDMVWHVIQPEDYEADGLAVRTLFDQFKQLRANAFAESTDASQADFSGPDYKLSVRMNDDALQLVLFKKAEEGDYYFAKNGDKDMVYTVDQPLVDGIFGLEFKAENPAQ